VQVQATLHNTVLQPSPGTVVGVRLRLGVEWNKFSEPAELAPESDIVFVPTARQDLNS